jgi:hypothetical protein
VQVWTNSLVGVHLVTHSEESNRDWSQIAIKASNKTLLTEKPPLLKGGFVWFFLNGSEHPYVGQSSPLREGGIARLRDHLSGVSTYDGQEGCAIG